MIMQQDQTLTGPVLQAQRPSERYFKVCLQTLKASSWDAVDTRIFGDKAYCEFHRIAKLKSGEVQDFLSIDVLTFRDGLIIHKDTFYKNRISP